MKLTSLSVSINLNLDLGFKTVRWSLQMLVLHVKLCAVTDGVTSYYTA